MSPLEASSAQESGRRPNKYTGRVSGLSFSNAEDLSEQRGGTPKARASPPEPQALRKTAPSQARRQPLDTCIREANEPMLPPNCAKTVAARRAYADALRCTRRAHSQPPPHTPATSTASSIQGAQGRASNQADTN